MALALPSASSTPQATLQVRLADLAGEKFKVDAALPSSALLPLCPFAHPQLCPTPPLPLCSQDIFYSIFDSHRSVSEVVPRFSRAA